MRFRINRLCLILVLWLSLAVLILTHLKGEWTLEVFIFRFKKKKIIYRIICIFYQFWNYYYYFLKDIYFRIMIRFWCSFLEDYCHFTSLQVHLVHLLSFDFLWVCLELECSPHFAIGFEYLIEWMVIYFPMYLGQCKNSDLDISVGGMLFFMLFCCNHSNRCR